MNQLLYYSRNITNNKIINLITTLFKTHIHFKTNKSKNEPT